MELPDELRKLAQNLSVPEKRFFKVLSKTRSGTDSQLLQLFDWLNNSVAEKPLPAHASFTRNLPTLAARLRAMILETLYLLHKDDNTETQLNSLLSEIQLLYSKKLINTAARQLRKAKILAADFSRYTHLLMFIQIEIQHAQKLPVELFSERLATLREEEKAVTVRLQHLQRLQHIHHQLLILIRKFPFSLEPEIVRQVRRLAEVDEVEDAIASPSFLEHALAVSILGIRDMFIRDPDSSVPRYQKLIRQWQKLPEWQKDQPQLLLTVCKYYQNACIFSPVDYSKINADLAFPQGFSGLPKEDQVMLQDLLYSNQFAMAINLGRFDVVIPMIAEIEQWLKKQSSLLNENQLYPYYCNFAVAEFLAGNFAAAGKQINRIIREHNRKARVDIYEFAIIMRTVLQYELDDHSLSEHLIRSGKRHFQKNKIVADFELMVMHHITQLIDANTVKEKKRCYRILREALDKFASTLPATIPLLGLNEVSMWAESKETGVSIRKIFLQRVEENLRMLEGVKKMGD